MGAELWHGDGSALGFTHDTPCAATFHTVFRPLDRDLFESSGSAHWLNRSLYFTPSPAADEGRGGMDGKTLRGPKQGAPGIHLLSAFCHHLGLTLAQQAVDDKTNEITQVEAVLRARPPRADVSQSMPSLPNGLSPRPLRRGGRLRHDRQRRISPSCWPILS